MERSHIHILVISPNLAYWISPIYILYSDIISVNCFNAYEEIWYSKLDSIGTIIGACFRYSKDRTNLTWKCTSSEVFVDIHLTTVRGPISQLTCGFIYFTIVIAQRCPKYGWSGSISPYWSHSPSLMSTLD